MKKRIVSLAAAAILSTTALAACGSSDDTDGNTAGGGTEATDSADGDAAGGGEADVNEDGTVNNPEAVEVDPNKLVFWSLFSGGDGGFMDQIIEDYNGTSPSQQVQSVMLVWADYYTKLTTAVATGNGPDIGVSHISKLPELVEKGVVIAIDDYADAAGTNWADYPDNSLEGVTFDGSKYAIPLDTHAEIAYANLDYFADAGIELDANGQLPVSNADDFAEILGKLKDVVGDGGTALSLPQTGDDPYRTWWATYFQLGGTPIISDDGTEVTLDKTTAAEAADYVKSLYDDGYVQPGITDHQKLFQDGSAGMMFGGTWANGAFEATEGLNFQPMLFPSLFGDNQAAWADSHVLIIPTNDDRTEEETQAAVDFINWVASEGGLTWAASGQIPSSSTVTSDPAFLELPNRDFYLEAKELAVLPAQSASFYGLKDAMIRNLDTIWNEQTDSTSAIDNMVDEMGSELG
ncbi:carbohydrate ABC transporter substrate-binding protein, CUT1 family [Ruaniaceae bacterium KH17]|nr:carbohydrate ABC transporter substrate-binding protein, CUT1 family [Ruaniaceae bacterium KH17]